MKKLLLIITLILNTTAEAADFTITVKPSSSFKKAVYYDGTTKIAEYIGSYGGDQFILTNGPYAGYFISGISGTDINATLRYQLKTQIGYFGGSCRYNNSSCLGNCIIGGSNMKSSKQLYRMGNRYFKTEDESPVVIGTLNTTYILNAAGACTASALSTNEYIEAVEVLDVDFPKASTIKINFE